MLWIAENVASSLIATLLALALAYIIYRYRQRPSVTVEIVINTKLATPTTKIVITNHGRAPTVITELNVHFSLKGAKFQSGSSSGSTFFDSAQLPHGWFKISRLFWIRRKLKTLGSHNDMLTLFAESWLSKGSAKADLIDSTETITVLPHEKVSRELVGRELHPLTAHVELPAAATLIPSCRVAKQQHVVWGSPVIVSELKLGGHSTAMVGAFRWGAKEPSL